jgi:hypothetical protein
VRGGARVFQCSEQSDQLHERLHGIYVTAGYTNDVLFNFLQSLIPTWYPVEHAKRQQHYCHVFKVLKSCMMTNLVKKFKFLMQYLLPNMRQKKVTERFCYSAFGFVINTNAALQ